MKIFISPFRERENQKLPFVLSMDLVEFNEKESMVNTMKPTKQSTCILYQLSLLDDSPLSSTFMRISKNSQHTTVCTYEFPLILAAQVKNKSITFGTSSSS
jgi:hypothetical protein